MVGALGISYISWCYLECSQKIKVALYGLKKTFYPWQSYIELLALAERAKGGGSADLLAVENHFVCLYFTLIYLQNRSRKHHDSIEMQ